MQKNTLAWCNDRWIRLKGGYTNWPEGRVFVEYRMDKEIFYNQDNINGINITNECGGSGEHYALQNIPNASYWIKSWGGMYVNGVRRVSFFHYHKWEPQKYVINSSWAGGGSNNRRAIQEQESWWDNFHGWYLNGNNMPAGSMGADGLPDGITVPIARYEDIAKNTGRQWKISTPSLNWSTSLYSSWFY